MTGGRAPGGGRGPAAGADQTTAADQVRLGEVLRGHQANEVSRRARLENDELEQKMGLRLRAFDSELDLRRRYARWLLRLMIVQLVAANATFAAYAGAGLGWQVPRDVMKAWLLATILQVIGAVAVVTRHLFPDRARTPLDL